MSETKTETNATQSAVLALPSILGIDDFSAAQRDVYLSKKFPLFQADRTPDFLVVLSIQNFFRHHLNHMQDNMIPAIREAFICHAEISRLCVCRSSLQLQTYNFEQQWIEGDWTGFYSYLDWIDFQELQDDKPAALQKNRSGLMTDYIGGPQQLTIRIRKSESTGTHKDLNEDLIITGAGVTGESFSFTDAKLRRIYRPREIVGNDSHLLWDITFTKIYTHAENSASRWNYNGIYYPGNLPSWMF